MAKYKAEEGPGKNGGKEISVPLDVLSHRMYTEYAMATLEDRAIGDYRDSFKPVHRRVLQSMYELGLHHKAKVVKSARVVGDTLGRFHPHGDQACYEAMVGMANRWLQMPLVEGQGNWGSLTDNGYAAHRYTEARLTKFADAVLFDKFYQVPTAVERVPNFDGSGKEPLVLPALLPLALINGMFGIATGAATNVPAFEYKTVLKTLKAVYEGQEIDAKFLYQNLRIVTTFGGTERKLTTKEEKQARMDIFRTPKGKVALWANPTYDEKKRTITATRFPFSSMEKKIEQILNSEGKKKNPLLEYVAEARDDSSKTDRYGVLTIVLKRTLTTKQYEKAPKVIDLALSSSETFNQNYTERYVDEEGQGQAKVRRMCVVDMLKAWVEWRTELERKACTYWIGEDDKEIRRLDLLSQAVDLIEFIISLLRNEKLDTDQVYEAYAKKAKCSTEEAKYVLNRPIITLRKLEKKALAAQRKQVVEHKEGLEKRRKKPAPFLANQIDDFMKLAPEA